jgi:hypothetical protein
MSHRAIPEAAREQLAGGLDNGPGSAESILFHDAEMAEVALLLPSIQAAALKRLAHQQRLTVAQLIRRLIRDCLASEDLLPRVFAIEREDNRQPREPFDFPQNQRKE